MGLGLKKSHIKIYGLIYIALCVLAGVVGGYFFYSVKEKTFLDRTGLEATRLQLLTSSYVSTYADIRRNVQVDVPVPAQFRAQAHHRFNNATQGGERMVALMVGLPGKEINTAPIDTELGQTLNEMSQSGAEVYAPFSSMQVIEGEAVFRSVFPSIASEPNCVSCHNRLQRGEHRWQKGDLMGAYVIDKGVETDLESMRFHATLMGALIAIALTLAGIVMHQYRRLLEQSGSLHVMAHTDSLTRCHNRRSLFDLVKRNHETQGCAGGLLSLDIDKFKSINDQFGHACGDQVLVHVADTIRKEIRGDDILARIGGEEFVVILPGADQQTSLSIANRICQSVARSPLFVDNTELPVTISIGLVQMENTSENLFSQWLEAADKLLYQAKNYGRNQVCHRSESHAS